MPAAASNANAPGTGTAVTVSDVAVPMYVSCIVTTSDRNRLYPVLPYAP